MFLLPPFLFLAAGLAQGTDFFRISPGDFLLNVGTAFFISYLGNRLSLSAIKDAPNPGYSLIIQKSYAAFTAVASVFLFSSPLSLLDIIGIATIIGFSSLIFLEKSPEEKEEKKKGRSGWLAKSFLLFFLWGILALVSTYLIRKGYDVGMLVFWRMAAVAIFISAEIALRKLPLLSAKKGMGAKNVAPIFLGVGFFSWLFNFAMNEGYKVAPNPGLISAANASSIAILTIASHFVFGDHLSARKLVGVAGVVFGLVLIFL
ncbi:MAG: hypothetical protein V1820_06865, partial [archaeon]